MHGGTSENVQGDRQSNYTSVVWLYQEQDKEVIAWKLERSPGACALGSFLSHPAPLQGHGLPWVGKCQLPLLSWLSVSTRLCLSRCGDALALYVRAAF